MTNEAFNEEVKLLRSRLVGLARSFLHEDAEADDVVQETLLRMWLLKERIGTNKDFTALAIRITKNVCVSVWRQKQKSQQIGLDAVAMLQDSLQTSDETETNENHQRLKRAVAMLAPAERRIFLLWEQDLGIQEIATIIGIKPRTVSSMLSLARRKLLSLLETTI